MKRLLVFGILFVLFSCTSNNTSNSVNVTNGDELNSAIKNSKPGDVIVMSDGVWKDTEIKFQANGTKENPIKLVAQTAGEVILSGQSNLRLGGEYLIVENLYFKDGYTPNNAVIQFRISKDIAAYNSKVVGCVIEDYTQLDRFAKDHWVEFWGRFNSLESCYISGKSNKGPTVRVQLKGNQHANNYHRIVNNYFGPRPRKGGPQGETMQIGDSYTSMVPAYVQVEGNLFDRCNGEVEIISSKSNYNVFKNNVFYKSEGSLVLRHGNYATIDSNWFIGDDNSEFIGGVRVINTGHWITNNYFYNLNGSMFRSPIAVMNGIPKSPLNRYNQVTDAVIAYNSWINCETPLQFSVGTNVDKIGVLPKSEIRSALPIRTTVANNVIFNESETSKDVVKFHDKKGDIKFVSNYVSSNNSGKSFEGFELKNLNFTNLAEMLFVPSSYDNLKSNYVGFDFNTIAKDINGNSREANNIAGAVTKELVKSNIVDKTIYGPKWYQNTNEEISSKTYAAKNELELQDALSKAKDGDVVELDSDRIIIQNPLFINESISIQSKNAAVKTVLEFKLEGNAAAIVLNKNSNLKVNNVEFIGSENIVLVTPNKSDMSIGSNLFIDKASISKFKSVYCAYKGSFADTISVTNSTINNIESGFNLAEETDAKGDYNAEFLLLKSNSINNVKKHFVDFYRGGYDESTIGGTFVFSNNQVFNAGDKGKVLLNSHGIVNVELNDNKFEKIRSKKIALLWGEKNNSHNGNEIKGSSKIEVQEHLSQKLVY